MLRSTRANPVPKFHDHARRKIVQIPRLSVVQNSAQISRRTSAQIMQLCAPKFRPDSALVRRPQFGLFWLRCTQSRTSMKSIWLGKTMRARKRIYCLAKDLMMRQYIKLLDDEGIHLRLKPAVLKIKILLSFLFCFQKTKMANHKNGKIFLFRKSLNILAKTTEMCHGMC